LKKYALKNNDIITSSSKLYNTFINEFGIVNLNFESLTIEEKEKMIIRYKKKKNIDENEQIEIEVVINLKNLCIGAYTFLRNYRSFNKEMKINLLNFTINDKKVITNIEVSFIRKNKIYKKDIFILMTPEMENNIGKTNNIQNRINIIKRL